MTFLHDEGSSSSSSSSSSPLQSFSQLPISPTSSLTTPCSAAAPSDERGLCLIHLLLNCATHLAAGALDKANACLDHVSLLAASDGDVMQRVASHFTEALARRVLRSWPGLYRALYNPPTLADALLARRLFFDLCPFVKLAALVTNQAVLEAMEGERMVHIVDLGGVSAAPYNPAQWLAFLRALSYRPDGPPHLRITAVDEHKDLLDTTGARLSEEAERLDIPFQFNGVVSRVEDLDVESLRVKTGEALAITSLLQLHCLLAPADHSPKLATFLASLLGLSPKVMVVTEQESNHNAPALNERFTEALNFYAALFDCLESTVPKASEERARVEKMLFGEEIKNIVACEGAERRERHERFERWVQRLELAGFASVPLSHNGMQQARRVLQSYGREGYRVREEKGCSFICWQDRPIYSVSAWSCRRCM